jgi:hypothetical protein
VLEDGERAHYEAQVEALRAHACRAAAEAERARTDAAMLRAELSASALAPQLMRLDSKPNHIVAAADGVGDAVAESRRAARARPSAYDSEAGSRDNY